MYWQYICIEIKPYCFMRIIIMSLFLGFVYINCNAQDSTKAKPAYIEQYCEIVASTKMFSSKLSLEIMYGDEVNTFWKHHDYRLKDAEGNLQKFNKVKVYLQKPNLVYPYSSYSLLHY